jgi:hypothetical protein
VCGTSAAPTKLASLKLARTKNYSYLAALAALAVLAVAAAAAAVVLAVVLAVVVAAGQC